MHKSSAVGRWKTCLLIICWPPAWHECTWPTSAWHLHWLGKPKVKWMQELCGCATGHVHLLDPALWWFFSSTLRETHSRKIMLRCVSCPVSRVPCGTSPSHESCGQAKAFLGWPAKAYNASALGQNQSTEVMHCFGRAVTPEREAPRGKTRL